MVSSTSIAYDADESCNSPALLSPTLRPQHRKMKQCTIKIRLNMTGTKQLPSTLKKLILIWIVSITNKTKITKNKNIECKIVVREEYEYIRRRARISKIIYVCKKKKKFLTHRET